jgi:hypothetical protein
MLESNQVQPVVSSVVTPVALEGYKIPLLNQFEGASAAYSLRRLKSWSDGENVVEVRRASDDTTRDFTAIEVSDGTMADWVGLGVDGYVATWYDQSGNGNDAVQNTATSQPKIVENGVLVADGIKFDGGQYLSNTALGSSFAGTAVPFSAFSTLKSNILTSNWVPFAFGSTTNTNPIYEPLVSASGSWGYFVRDDSGGIKDDLTLTTGSLNAEVLSCTSTGSLLDFFQNGTAFATNEDISLGSLTTNVFAIGALVRSTVLNFLDGTISEIIIYDSDQSAKRTDIEGNINDYYEIFADETYRRPDGSAIFRPDGTSVYERP